MQINDLKPKLKKKKEKRIGRGGKRGTYSGKGIKGQKARAGASTPSYEKETISKFPKLKGLKNT
ncbi:MAG: 50S ribosomal protein L15, partial [Candidatus Paceibacterota bacterium]